MPKAARRTSGPSAARKEPYPKDQDKENTNPSPPPASDPHHRTPNYQDIYLEEIDGEVPIYETASLIRRKLTKLIMDKVPIPNTSNKTFNNTTMAAQMYELRVRSGTVISSTNRNGGGPGPRSLTTFRGKKGEMGGGDSECYYWGNVLLEKMRIWKGEKKSKARLRAKEE
ncbi:hypothetical protein MMC12_004931 [Toensbergia leucococca]|nr:hypothetical protein [Toensbergia leucococca]